MATYSQFKHVELYKIGHGKNRVPNAPKSSIGEIFNNGTSTDSGPVNNGTFRHRIVRDTPTCPRNTHARLFGEATHNNSVAPMVTDTVRSHIQFGDQSSGLQSPAKVNGSVSSTASRASYTPPKRNPVTGDGVPVPLQRRPHPAASLRGAHPDYDPDLTDADPFEPQPTHRYVTRDWPPRPAEYNVESTTRPSLNLRQTPYSLIGLKPDDAKKSRPSTDPNSYSQIVLDRHWPPFPGQHYLEPKEHKIPHYPLPPYAFMGLTSKLEDRPHLDFKYNPIPTLDGPIDPFLIANNQPPMMSVFKYERDGPIPDVTPLETPGYPGPRTLTGFPPTFHKHVPGYLFSLNQHAEDFRPKTYFVDYIRRRAMEGNPITGDGYKSSNKVNLSPSSRYSANSNSRVPPGGYSSRLW